VTQYAKAMAAVIISTSVGEAALQDWRASREATATQQLATAVRYTLQLLAKQSPGASLEVRVPPFGAVQCLEGSRHTRGTPPNVVEMSSELWLQLATGEVTWSDAQRTSGVNASGVRASLEGLIPVVKADSR